MVESDTSKPARHWFHVPIQITVLFFCIHWHRHVPLPNMAVLFLGGVAAIMALVEMRPFHKAIYFALIVWLMFIESHAINKDREGFAREQETARKTEREQFNGIGKGVTDGVEKILANNREQFRDMLQQQSTEFDQTMTRVTKLEQNTSRYADVQFQSLVPLAPNPFFDPTNHSWNVYDLNAGNEDATDFVLDAKMFIGKPDDLDTAKRVVAEFDKWWVTAEHQHWRGIVMRTGAGLTPKFYTITGVVPNQLEAEDLRNHVQTVYFVVRAEYSDHSGRWSSGDLCSSFQDVISNLRIHHPCPIKPEGRHKIKQSH